MDVFVDVVVAVVFAVVLRQYNTIQYNTVYSAIKHFTMFLAYTNINEKFIYRDANIYVNDNILQ